MCQASVRDSFSQGAITITNSHTSVLLKPDSTVCTMLPEENSPWSQALLSMKTLRADKTFTYLGNMVCRQANTDHEVNRRIAIYFISKLKVYQDTTLCFFVHVPWILKQTEELLSYNMSRHAKQDDNIRFLILKSSPVLACTTLENWSDGLDWGVGGWHKSSTTETGVVSPFHIVQTVVTVYSMHSNTP